MPGRLILLLWPMSKRLHFNCRACGDRRVRPGPLPLIRLKTYARIDVIPCLLFVSDVATFNLDQMIYKVFQQGDS